MAPVSTLPAPPALEPAPFHAPAPAGLPQPLAVWTRADDGVRLRLVLFPAPPGGRGWLILCPGRSEWAEKYALAAAEFGARGYGLMLPDWRGQALSDRLHPDPRLGHVHRFADYQRDLAALLAAARALGLPPPAGIVAHSMGGAIALRALDAGLAVPAAAFSAPMWGIRLGTLLRPAVQLATAMVARAGREPPPPPTAAYLSFAPFEGNALTSDPAIYAAMQAAVRARPEFALGTPTLHWLSEAIRETRRLAARPSPRLPALVAVGSDETVIDTDAVRARTARWPGARLLTIPGARHEPMMERPGLRAAFYDAAAALFDAAAGAARTTGGSG